MAGSYRYAGRVEHLGLLRSYLTRHGAGPFPTEDSSLDGLAEPHNSHAGWQGRFRRGHPDGVLLRYALEVTGWLDGLLISHLDVFAKGLPLKWADGYTNIYGDRASERMTACANNNLAYQRSLTDYLTDVQPDYAPGTVGSSSDLIERFASVSNCPVWFGAFGPAHQNVLQAVNGVF
ncbi:MAG: adenylosuccinate synthetase [Azonexus sp.]|jgi:adenylosuccinate synthase|uniref:adenylosuccinate synthetase n=1 Tax=Azonexus sp. TaxID=1872668 RepID=UPI0028385E19|nr:adenylosuccinate synthetase [Azonexus sp.]MDR0777294.1 adenylosuccinate synthetase [Azonexus sp.]